MNASLTYSRNYSMDRDRALTLFSLEEAIEEEFFALEKKKIRDYNPKSFCKEIFGMSVEYAFKFNEDGTVERYKAILVLRDRPKHIEYTLKPLCCYLR